MFVNSCLYSLSVRTQISDHGTLNYHLQHVSAVFDHHQVVLTITCMEKNMVADGKHKQPKHVVDDNLMYRALQCVFRTESKHRHSL